MAGCAYIVDFASITLTCRCVRNAGETGKNPLRKRVERVASRLFHNHALTCGCLKAEEVFHGGKVRGLHVFREEKLLYRGFIGDRKSFLESILFYRYVVPAEILLQHRLF
jgi:hypothetical protein